MIYSTHRHSTVLMSLLVTTLCIAVVGFNVRAREPGKIIGSIRSGTSLLSPTKTAEMPDTYDKISARDLHHYLTDKGVLNFSTGVAHIRHRKCRAGSDCTAGDSSLVYIYPEEGAMGVGSWSTGSDYVDLTGGKSNSYVIARLWNDSNSPTEDWLGLAPGDTAYWLVEPDASGHARSRFIQVHSSWVFFWKKNVIDPPGSLLFFACKHESKPKVEADFGYCADHKGPNDPISTPGAYDDPDRGQGRDLSGDVKSSWISCVAGCCTANTGDTKDPYWNKPMHPGTSKSAAPAPARTTAPKKRPTS